MKYLLDANVFIEAKNRYYAFDICPGFWAWMDHIVTDGNVMTIMMVRDELLRGNDELAEWVEARRDADWFNAVDDTPTQTTFQQIVAVVQGGDYSNPAKAQFLAGADPWLVAKAQSIQATIVTHETAQPQSKKRVPLPNICDQFGVPWVNTFDVLRALAVAFTYEPA